MTNENLVYVVALGAMLLAAIALLLYALRITRATDLVSRMSYTFHVPKGTNMPLAPGVWTIWPGRGEIRWTGQQAMTESPADVTE